MRLGFRALAMAAVGALFALSMTGVAAAPANAVGLPPCGLTCDDPLPPSPAGCSSAATGGTLALTLPDKNGVNRPFRLFVPSGLSGAAPLVVALHGGQDNPTHFETATGWTAVAQSKKFIVAYPQGGKNDGAADKWAWEFSASNPANDVPFLRSLVHAIGDDYCVNPKRVHFIGHSNGGQMTSRMACSASDLVASAAVWAGPSGAWDANDCPTTRKLSFGVMLNDNDPIVWQIVAEQHRDLWRTKDSCGATPASETGTAVVKGERYSCASGTQVLYRLYHTTDDATKAHLWPTPGSAAATDVNNRMWSLLNANPLP
ncbi:alpha/beta hydrolase family esterase [Nocardia sp. NPDC004151]|uniref:alpha/beta hydrolase family esterase n=1 Tax=Nocardia sp. NPDC004151 TaxID=3364304 RepID=UPI003695429A